MKKIRTDGRVFLTSSQLASRWGWHEDSVRRKIRRHELSSVLVGRRRLVPLAEVELLERQGSVPRQQAGPARGTEARIAIDPPEGLGSALVVKLSSSARDQQTAQP